MTRLYPDTWAAEDPERLAFEMCATGERVTYGQLNARSNQGAQVIRALGLRAGDHVAILMENSRHFLELVFAADRAGLYYTTIHSRLTTREIAFIIEDCGATLLIASPKMLRKHPDLAMLTDHLVPHRYTTGTAQAGFASWEEACAAMPATPIADEHQGLDMLYSSGTTGRPKGVKWPMLDHPPGERIMMVDLLTRLFGYSYDSRYLCPAPLYHAAPQRHVMTVLKMGGQVFIMDRFDAEQALALIQDHRITHSQWVPTMFVRLLKLAPEVRARYDVCSQQMAVHAAAPCPVPVKEQMIAWWGPIIHEYYAGTENNGFCAITPTEWLAHKGSVGRALHGTLHICDDAGEPLGPGEVGHVYFSGGQRFEYHNQPEATAKTRNARGWTTIGDIGEMDADGYLYLRDRKAFVIISGGVNIYPQEIEDVLIAHPDVLDAAVFGVPDEDFGEAVKAVVELRPEVKPGDEALAAALIAHCREHLADFKCPKSLDFMDALPRAQTGKLYKRQLRDAYWP